MANSLEGPLKAMNDAVALDKTYFGKDKEGKIKQLAEEGLKLLEQVQSDNKVEQLFIKGKLMFFLNNIKAAEELFNQAQTPTDSKIWCALGETMIKKGDILSAKASLETAIRENKKCKDAYQLLSMVIKTIGKTNEEKRANAKEAIRLANEVILMDTTDSESWYILGNAYLTNFFTTYESLQDLEMALKAYTESETHQKYKNPDLYYNRAQVFSYFEKFHESIKDYLESYKIDPTLEGKKVADSLEQFVIKMASLIMKKANIKPKRLAEYAQMLPTTIEALGIKTEGYSLASFSDLKMGANPKKCLVCRIIMHVENGIEVPM